ncbi:MAG: xanthine dehydrogenase family protein subunit M [Deltaproteobacteria bacterium]|nr:xanthine dehydrogenase family protein subunit M [Deltaproteobacteria bacterium]
MRSAYAYYRPHTLAEALELAAREPKARFIAGGTDLLVKLKKRRMEEPRALISLRNISELASLSHDAAGELVIGAGAPLSDVLLHPRVVEDYPALAASIQVLGSQQIRNVATLGGNLCNASPAADTAPALMIYGANAVLTRAAGARRIAVESMFVGPGQTVIEPGEILTEVRIPKPSARARSAFLRKGRVQMDLAIASAAVLLELEGTRCTKARVAVGAVAPVPLRLLEVEAVLSGSELSPSVLAQAKELVRARVSPIDDLRSSAVYRRELVAVLVARAALAAKGVA